MQFINTNMQNKLFSIIGILVLAVLISGCVQSQKYVAKETVIAVFLGEQSTGGYSIEIKKIVETEQCDLPRYTPFGAELKCPPPKYAVFIKETSPGRGA